MGDNVETRKQLAEAVIASYVEYPCGICEQRSPDGSSAEVFWFSRLSRTAHKACVEKLEDVEALSDELLRDWGGKYKYAEGHMAVVKIVRDQVGVPLLEALEQPTGKLKLKNLFDEATDAFLLRKRYEDACKKQRQKRMERIIEKIRKDVEKSE